LSVDRPSRLDERQLPHRHLLSDRLGSTSLVTDQSGAEQARQLYKPFGESRWSSGTLLTDRNPSTPLRM
jgi:hypothetical protein